MNHPLENTSEAAAVADITEEAVEGRLQTVDPRDVTLFRGQRVDLDGFLGEPRRIKGTTEVTDDASFVEHVKRFLHPDVLIFANVFDFAFQAVYNESTSEIPGWGDHRTSLALRPTLEWRHWASQSAKLMKQTDFADHIELGAQEVVTPDAATMLELAQSFQAHTNVDFESSSLLDNGQRRLTYKETVSAKAGQTGQIDIPKELELGIAPFEGTEPYRVFARLRFRLSGPELLLGYTLDRPEVVQRSAFDDVQERIRSATDLTIINGKPATGV